MGRPRARKMTAPVVIDLVAGDENGYEDKSDVVELDAFGNPANTVSRRNAGRSSDGCGGGGGGGAVCYEGNGNFHGYDDDVDGRRRRGAGRDGRRRRGREADLCGAPFNQAEYEQLLRRVNNNSYNFYDSVDGPYQQLLHFRHPPHPHLHQQQQQQQTHQLSQQQFHHLHQPQQQHLQLQKKQQEEHKARVRERKQLRQAQGDQKPPVLLVVVDDDDDDADADEGNHSSNFRSEIDHDDDKNHKIPVNYSGMASSSSPVLTARSPVASSPLSYPAPPPSPADLEAYFKEPESSSPSPEPHSRRSRSSKPKAPPPTRDVSPLPLPPPMVPLLPDSSNSTSVHQGPSGKRPADAITKGKGSTTLGAAAAKKAKTHGRSGGSFRASKKTAKSWLPNDSDKDKIDYDDTDHDSEDDERLIMESIESNDGCFPDIPSAHSLAGCVTALREAERQGKEIRKKNLSESIENDDGGFPDIPSAHRPSENYDAYRETPISIQSRKSGRARRGRSAYVIVSSDSDDEEYIPPRRQRSSRPRQQLTRAYRKAQLEEQLHILPSQAGTGGVKAGEDTEGEGNKGQLAAALGKEAQKPTSGPSEPAPRQRPRAPSSNFWPTVTFGVPSHWPRYLDMLMWSLRGQADAVHQRLQELCRFEPPLSCEWVRLRLKETAVQHQEFVLRYLPGEAGTAARVRIRSALLKSQHDFFHEGPGTDRTPLPDDPLYAAEPPLPDGAPDAWTLDLDRVVREAVLTRRTPAETMDLLRNAAENDGQTLHGLSRSWVEVRMAQSEWLLLDP